MTDSVQKIRLECLPKTHWHEDELLNCWSKDAKSGRFRLTMKITKNVDYLFKSYFDKYFTSDVLEVVLYHQGVDGGNTKIARGISFGKLLESQPEGDTDCLHIEYAVEPLKADPPRGMVDKNGRAVASAGRVLAKSKSQQAQPPSKPQRSATPKQKSTPKQKTASASVSSKSQVLEETADIQQDKTAKQQPPSRKRRSVSTPAAQASSDSSTPAISEDVLILPG